MTRSKKKKDESNITIFSFGIDKNDPKYHNLITYLEDIDSGARSYVIRQMLNSYVNSQTPSPVFSLIPSVPTVQPQPQYKEVEVEEKKEVPVVARTEETKQEEKVAPVVKETSPTPIETNPVNTIVQEDKTVKKPKKDSRLASLANTFN
jgi:hypothetical protein